MLNYKNHNRRGAAIGETLTWVVAGLIILMVVITFIFLSSLLSQFKTISIGDVRTDIKNSSEQIATKTNLAEQLTNNENKQEVDKILNKQNGG